MEGNVVRGGPATGTVIGGSKGGEVRVDVWGGSVGVGSGSSVLMLVRGSERVCCGMMGVGSSGSNLSDVICGGDATRWFDAVKVCGSGSVSSVRSMMSGRRAMLGSGEVGCIPFRNVRGVAVPR